MKRNKLKELTYTVITMLRSYSENRDLAVYYPEFLSLYTVVYLHENNFFDCKYQNISERLKSSKSNNIAIEVNKLYKDLEEKHEYLANVFCQIELSSNDNEYIREMNAKLINVFETLEHIKLEGLYGEVFSSLIEYASTNSGRKAGNFATPSIITRLMIELLAPESAKTIYDPVCGSGGLLVEAENFVKRNNPGSGLKGVYGEEINSTTLRIAKQNLIINGCINSIVWNSNSLTNPSTQIDDNNYRKFDYVLANPPFSIKKWDEQISVQKDSRFNYGPPPSGSADFAFVQHCLSSLKDRGKAAIIVSPGSLFRMGAEGKIRKRLIEENLISCVISLPPNLFHNTMIAPNILILDKCKLDDKVVLIDASSDFEKNGKTLTLNEGCIKNILNSFKQSVAHSSKVVFVKNEDLLEKNGLLSVSSYFVNSIDSTIEESFEELTKKQDDLFMKLEKLNSNLQSVLYK